MTRTRNVLAEWMLVTSRRAAWAPLLVFGLHVIFSRIIGGYLIFPPLDIPMHFFGGMAITHFLAYAFAVAAALGLLGSPNRLVFFLLTLFGACSTTIFWEFAEFLSDRVLGTHAQLDLEDTLSDMLLGILGALVYLIARRFTPPLVVLQTMRTQTEVKSIRA